MKKPAAKAPVKTGGGAAGGGGGGAGKAPAAGKHQAKAKAKPAKVSRAVHRARRQAALRGAATRKQHAATAKKRGLALGSAVACCSVEALAASLRLTGWPVTDADVLALHRLAGGGDDAGAPIVAALEAASEFGLAGVLPVSFQALSLDLPFDAPEFQVPVILGVELPGAHAVLAICADDDEWLTWGECWPVSAFPDAAIEEAWAITWPA